MKLDFAFWEYYLAAAQLILATLGMGVSLAPRDFWQVIKAPKALALVLVAHWVVTPLLALGLARCFSLPVGFTAGLILMMAMPAGAMSNIFTHLGRGNAPLSLSATAITTLGSLVTTAAVLRIYGAEHFQAIEMPIGRILLEIGSFLLLPLALAMVIGRLSPTRSQMIGKWCIRGSLMVLTTLVIGSLTSGRLPIAAYGWLPPLALILFGGVIMGLCYAAGFLSGLPLSDSFTVALLVTVRNGNLGLLMKASLFPAVAGVADPVGNGVLYVVLFYSGVALVLAIAAVVRRRVGMFGVAAAAAAAR